MHSIKAKKSKFNAVATSLPTEVAERISDMLTNPPTEDPYQELKKRILYKYEISPAKKITQLIEDSELRDEKPTQFCALSPKVEFQHKMLFDIVMRKLPKIVRAVLVMTDVKDIERAAQAADKAIDL
jgi:hypothetical protein